MGNVVLCKDTQSENYLPDLRYFFLSLNSAVCKVLFSQPNMNAAQSVKEKVFTKQLN